MENKLLKTLIEETRSVKMLLILQLLGQGFKQAQIAKMLGVSEATMSRMLPSGVGRSVLGKAKQAGGDVDV